MVEDTDSLATEPLIWILSSPSQISQVKVLLRQSGFHNRSQPIVKGSTIICQEFRLLPSGERPPADAPWIAVPTSLLASAAGILQETTLPLIDGDSTLLACRDGGSPVARSEVPADGHSKSDARGNALFRAVRHWLYRYIDELPLDAPSAERLLAGSWRFHKYESLLLVPGGTFSCGAWGATLAKIPSMRVDSFYAAIATALRVTHIAEQGSIPSHSRHGDPQAEPGSLSENVLRSPLALRPLHGSFGPHEEDATSEAFARAMWVTVRQHGIVQEFAPLYSMFSNGNVGEKARLMQVARASKAVAEPEAAVDLYAGIGYFAFSLVKAGYKPVLCWELNGWSLEGMRRGARRNGWTTHDVPMREEPEQRNRGAEGTRRSCIEDEVDADADADALASKEMLDHDLLLFHETNAHALARIRALRAYLSPVRHVSCGYLPSSEASWAHAVRILDRDRGGWVHAHQNCAVGEIEQRASEIERRFQTVLDQDQGDGVWRVARCEHVARVKTFAPGVMHCVFDVRVAGGQGY